MLRINKNSYKKNYLKKGLRNVGTLRLIYIGHNNGADCD